MVKLPGTHALCPLSIKILQEKNHTVHNLILHTLYAKIFNFNFSAICWYTRRSSVAPLRLRDSVTPMHVNYRAHSILTICFVYVTDCKI